LFATADGMLKLAVKLSAIAAFVVTFVTPTYTQTPAATPPQAGAHPTGTSLDPKWDVTLGYQLLHVPDQTRPFGLNVDGAVNFGAASLVAEAGWSLDTGDSITSHLFNIGAGPRWTGRSEGRAWPFAQVLAGLAHARTSIDVAGADVTSSSTKFMLQPGVGAVFVTSDGWGIVTQIDYRRIFLDEEEDGESGENDFRVFLGIRLILD
jgi:hypothetical protein